MLLFVVPVEALLLGAERPGEVEQLARGGAARHFHRRARRAQALVEGLDGRVVLRGAEGGHVQCGAETPVAIVPDARPAADAAPRLARHRREPRIRCEAHRAVTEGEVQCADEEPGRRDEADARRAREARQRLRPAARGEDLGDLSVEADHPPLEIGDQLVALLVDAGDHHRPLLERVPLVAGLRPHDEQRVPGDQPLSDLVVDRRGRRPRGGLERGGELREVPRVQRVGLGPPRLRLGAVVRLAWVDDGDPVARLVQRDREGHPVVAGRRRHHEGRRRHDPAGTQAALQRRIARRRLREGDRQRWGAARREPGRREGVGRDVDAHVEPIRRGGVRHRPS